jgi:hypothetical protein
MRRRKDQAGLCRAMGLAAALALAPPASSAEIPSPFAITDISEALTRAYNGEDAPALHGLLAPAVQARYTPEAVRRALTLCRVLTGDIFRLSTPSWGARHYGFFGVYAETGVFDMVLEIDPAEKIIHWVISDNVTAREQQCRIGAKGDAGPAVVPVR